VLLPGSLAGPAGFFSLCINSQPGFSEKQFQDNPSEEKRTECYPMAANDDSLREEVDARARLIYALLSEEGDVTLTSRTGSDVDAEERFSRDSIDAHLGRINELLSDSHHDEPDDLALHEQAEPMTDPSVRADLDARIGRLNNLLTELENFRHRDETLDLQIQCGNLTEDNTHLETKIQEGLAREEIADGMIQNLRQEVDDLRLELANEKSKNWELTYKCRDLAERAWRIEQKDKGDDGGREDGQHPDNSAEY
ncbi:hypothetical protein QBC42DRAFT_315047, partial [Cladorrhinum samala]